MWYIVYRTPFKSYEVDQGNGYFVRYKNKLSDEYSPNWFEASKYKSIGNALTRVGVYGCKVTTLDKFIIANPIEDIGLKRESQLNKIFNISKSDDEIISEIINNKGHIDKIGDNGEFVGDATDEVVEFIKSNILSNNKKFKNDYIVETKQDIVETKQDEDFWDGF